MLSHLEKRTGKSFKNQNEMLEEISAPLIQAKKEMGEGVDTLIGTLYFEVSSLYQSCTVYL